MKELGLAPSVGNLESISPRRKRTEVLEEK